IACSFGTSMLLVAAPTIVVAESPAHRTSEATGLLQVVRMAFQGVGAQMMLLLLATSMVSNPAGVGEYPGPDAYRLTMIVMGGLCLVTAAAALALPRWRQTRISASSQLGQLTSIAGGETLGPPRG